MNHAALFLLVSLFHLLLPPSALADWTAQQSGTTVDLEGISSIDVSNVWCVGGITSGSAYTILHTTNGGMTWTSQLSGSGFRLYDVDFVDASNGWAVGEFGTILHTADGGTTWSFQTSNDPHNLFGVHFVDSQTGWVSGDWQTLLHTTNGGTTWIQQTVAPQRGLEDVFFVSSTTGWTSGNGGSVFLTTDGGNTWQQQNSGVTSSLNGPFFSDALRGWVPGGGFVLHTSNGGTTWTQQTTETSQALNELHFANADEGWVVGSAGIIIRTMNGGVTWENQTSGTGENLRAVEFADTEVGWAVGYGGTILHTTNGGNSSAIPCADILHFQSRCRPSGNIQARIVLANTDHTGETVVFSIDGVPYETGVGHDAKALLSIGGFSAGAHSVELSNPAGCYDPLTIRCRVGESIEYGDFWEQDLSWETPVATTLSDNYPNPFNPSTTIRYGLNEPGAVSLTIYNTLGQLVRTIVEAYQTEGYHEAVWDGRNEVGGTVASGIYIYRMTTGSFVETKRMLLIK